jgi:hypothetical protein
MFIAVLYCPCNFIFKNRLGLDAAIADQFIHIYIGSPHSEIKFKCEVVSDSVDEKLLSENEYAIPAKKSNNYFSKKEKYIQMKLITEYPNGTFKLEDLREHGLGQVQIQARTDRRLQQYINEKESEIFDKEEVTTNA